MPINISAIIWAKKEDKHGLCPIALQITGGGSRTLYNTKIKVAAEHFEDGQISKDAENGDMLNIQLQELITSTRREILNRELQGEKITVESVKELLNPTPTRSRNFYTYAKAIVSQKKPPTKKRYTAEITKLVAYASKLTFANITPKWLSAYYVYLTTSTPDKPKANDHNTAWNAFKLIRHVFITAIEDKIISRDNNPFKDWKFPNYKAKKKEYLRLDECERIYGLLHRDDISRDIKTVSAFFLIECYAGTRISDWGKFNIEIMGGERYMTFTTQKTDTDVRIPVDHMPSLQKVVDYVLDNKLKFKMSAKDANLHLKTIQALAKIKVNLTSHVGRHTFASTWLSKGMSRASIAAMMGVNERQVATYAKFDMSGIKDEIRRIGGI